MTSETPTPDEPQISETRTAPPPPATGAAPSASGNVATAAPVTQTTAPTATVGKTHLSYGQFLGRAITASLVAPIGLAIAAVVLVAVIAGIVGALAGGGAPTNANDPIAITDHIDGADGSDDVVLVVDVNGVILAEGSGGGPFGGAVAGGDTIKEQLEAAAEDSDVDAVILRLNTPGGSVVGSELITDGVAAVQAAGKPVVAHVTEISASGGMWAMAPADHIVASNGSIVGSIGVILGPLSTFTDVVAIDGGILGGGVETTGGIDQFFITAGEGKDAGNPFRDLTEFEQEMFQNLVDGSYEDFVDHVATNRELNPATIINEIGASVFNAADAVDAGLVDETGNLDRAHEVAAELAGFEGDYDVRAVGRTPSLLDALLGADSEPELADLSSICSPTPMAHVYFGDLAAFCAGN